MFGINEVLVDLKNGLGIGLSIVKIIVYVYNGKMEMMIGRGKILVWIYLKWGEELWSNLFYWLKMI